DFFACLVDFINDDVRRLDEFARSRVKSGSAHVLKPWRCKSVNPSTNAPDHVGGSARVVLGNPSKDAIQIFVGLCAAEDVHTAKRRSRSSNSARVSVFGSFSARRRRSSVNCSSVKW